MILLIHWSKPWHEWISEGFARAGYPTKSLTQSSSLDDLIRQVEETSPKSVVIRNLEFIPWSMTTQEAERAQQTRYEEFFTYLKNKNIPTFFWFHDVPFGWGFGHLFDVKKALSRLCGASHIHIGVNDSSHLEMFQNLGLQAHFVPVAAPDFIFDRIPVGSPISETFTHAFSFSGTLHWGAQTSLRAPHDAIVHEFGAFAGAELLKMGLSEKAFEILKPGLIQFFKLWVNGEDQLQELSRFLRTQLHSLADLSEVKSELALQTLLEMHHHFQIFETVRVCIVKYGLELFGAPFWNYCLKDYPRPTSRLSFDDLIALYQTSRVSFGVTKWHFPRGIHERAFMIYACGGLPLLDERSDLFRVYERDEILTYRTLLDIPPLLERIGADLRFRTELIQKARAKIHAHHLYSHRAMSIMQILTGVQG